MFDDIYQEYFKNLDKEIEYLKDFFEGAGNVAKTMEESSNTVEISKSSFLSIMNTSIIKNSSDEVFKYTKELLNEFDEQQKFFYMLKSYHEIIKSIIELLITSKKNEKKYMEELNNYLNKCF